MTHIHDTDHLDAGVPNVDAWVAGLEWFDLDPSKLPDLPWQSQVGQIVRVSYVPHQHYAKPDGCASKV